MVDVGDHLKISVLMENQGQQVYNVWNFRVAGSPQAIPAVQVAEAYWNHVKASYRALAVGAYLSQRFLSIKVEENESPLGEAATWAIPPAEQVGTRIAPGVSADPQPSFMSAGIRLTVPTRATRPGQKRIPFLLEADTSGQLVVPAFVALVNNVAIAHTVNILLGAPALGMDLRCEIYGKGNTEPPVFVYQDVNGYATNPYVTTQNSRKQGRGA